MTGEHIKHQPLPWFAFNIAEYVTDTMKLGAESHGCYLLLMLDYYANAEPCPDDDFVLAAVCKLPEEAWKKHRRVLEPHFDVRDGHWFHKRIERELAESSRRLAAAKALAVAGGKARAAQRAGKAAETPAKPDATAAAQPAAQPATQPQAQPAASRAPSRGPAHSTLNKEDSLSTAAPVETDFEEGLEPPEQEPIGNPIPPNWRPSDQAIVLYLEESTQEELEREVTTFVNRNLSEGGFSANWNAAFSTWWIRFKDHRAKQAKKAPARIEVNNKTPAEVVEQQAADFDAAVKIFAKGMQWPRGLGPEPGQPGCKVPQSIILKHGIDPATGMRAAKETV